MGGVRAKVWRVRPAAAGSVAISCVFDSAASPVAAVSSSWKGACEAMKFCLRTSGCTFQCAASPAAVVSSSWKGACIGNRRHLVLTSMSSSWFACNAHACTG